jgi:5-methylthioadenosine/S-adenosylhomocysteine deaminase
MSASLIRSRALVTHAIDRHRWNEITDGAVLQEDGAIVEIGTYRDLSRRHPNVAVIGSGNEVMLPGFVNGHHHIGLTPVQLGSPDMPLELWFVTRMVMRNVNLYLDTLYSAFEMIASGVTTVQHLHGAVSPESSIRWIGVATRRSAPTRMSECVSHIRTRCATRTG